MGQAGRTHPDAGFDELRTERLIIRRFKTQDGVTFAGYRSDPGVAQYQTWDAPFSIDEARRFIDGVAHDHPDTPGEWFQFALEVQHSGTHVGDVAALCDRDDPRLASIGFTLAPSAQGQGYATEAVRALLTYLFDERGKHRVAADCDTRNTSSIRLLERVGMRREAHHIRSAWWKGEWTDEYGYALLASEWSQQDSSPPACVIDLPPHLFAQALELWSEAGLTRPWNDAHQDLQRAVHGGESTVLAGVDGQRLVGTAMVGHDGHRGWIYYMAVRQDARGRGHGRRLVRACEQWVRARNIPKVQLMVRDGNDTAASFYERLGYERSAVSVLGRRLDGGSAQAAPTGDGRGV